MNKRAISFVLVLVVLLMAFAPMVDASSNRLLRLGSRGSDVRTLQQRLNSLGYNCGSVDGIFGRNTLDAVRSFQRKNGLAVDGLVGRDTRSKLYSGSSTPSRGGGTSSKPSPSPGSGTSNNNSPITGLLRRGSRGSQVRTLQARLNQLGYNCGTVDGIFGGATYNGVVRFQRANRLAVDGIVGNATVSKLYPKTPVKPTPTPKPDPKPTPKPTPPANNTPITSLLRRGSRGSQVRTLQSRLNQLGYNCGTVDGIFGGATYNAVVRFQRAKGLAVDGIVGRNTIDKLYPKTPEKPKHDPGLNDYVEFDVKADSLKGKTVIIDAGHGGSDSGASRDGYHEKTFTLDMSKRLERMLKIAGAEVIMTRTGDVNYSLQYRANIANEKVLDQEIKRVETEISEAENDMESLEGNFELLQEDIDNLSNEIVKLKEELEDLNKIENCQLNQEGINGFTIQIEENKEELNALKEQNILNQIAIDELKAVIQANQDELIILKEADNAEDEAIDALESQIARQEADLIKLEEEQRTNQEAITNLIDKIGQDQARVIILQEKNEEDDLKNKASELKNEILQKEEKLENIKPELDGLKTIQEKLDELRIELINLQDYKAKLSTLTNGYRLKPANDKLVDVFNCSNNYDNIIFISIHNNSSGAISQTGASGIRVYYRPTIVADNENDSNKVYYNGYNDNGRKLFAEILNQQMQAKSEFATKTNRLYGRNDFAVLREQNLVSALVEVGFMNNPNDLALLKRQQTREDLAAGMYNGIGKYFQAIHKQ